MVAITPRYQHTQRLAALANRDPVAYRRQYGRHIVLGYCVLAAYVLQPLLAWLAILYCWLRLTQSASQWMTSWAAIFCLVLLWQTLPIVAASWRVIQQMLNFVVPVGMPLQPADAPQLFKILDRMCQQLGVAPIYQVYLTPEFGASILQFTRHLGFGRSRSYLCLGVPLLAGVSPLQLQAILGHEVGHMANRDSEFRNYAATIARVWQDTVNYGVARRSAWAPLLHSFACWYLPIATEYFFVSARLDEYRATSYSAELTNRQQAAAALIQLSIQAVHWHQSQQTTFQQANHYPQVPVDLFRQTLDLFAQPLSEESRQQLLENGLAAETAETAIHPCLRELLLTLGYRGSNVVSVPHPAETAAQKYILDCWDSIVMQCDRQWATIHAPTWQKQYYDFQNPSHYRS